ncbi:repetitive organellar protein-like [Pectinophora gossypiella]|uniref:repetitive organellar protein-like n=1 Tax=Pectinophora gossypiella TaxID=13191 RepID=UPI00214E1AC4|nr:repetitive organellar protein-like [Pectinophora gossypiella]
MKPARTPPSKTQGFDSTSDNTDRDTDGVNVGRRTKRKRDEIYEDSMKSFMDEMKSLFSTFSGNQNEKLSQLQTSVQTITNQNSSLHAKLTSMESSISELRSEITSVQQEYQNMNTRIKEIESDITDMKQSLEYTSAEQKDLNNKIKSFENNSNISEKMKSEIEDLHTTISILKSEIMEQQQRDRLLNLEITGLPEMTHENLSELVIKLAKYAEVELVPEDIVHVTRVQPRKNTAGRPKAIVLKLKKRIIKDNILAGIRKKRGLSTEDICITGEPRRIYVNEHLTVDNKLLYKKCREAAKTSGCKYVWIKNCLIFMRKDDNSKSMNIKNDLDIKKVWE